MDTYGGWQHLEPAEIVFESLGIGPKLCCQNLRSWGILGVFLRGSHSKGQGFFSIHGQLGATFWSIWWFHSYSFFRCLPQKNESNFHQFGEEPLPIRRFNYQLRLQNVKPNPRFFPHRKQALHLDRFLDTFFTIFQLKKGRLRFKIIWRLACDLKVPNENLVAGIDSIDYVCVSWLFFCRIQRKMIQKISSLENGNGIFRTPSCLQENGGQS